ncbi:UBA/TS-N domain-containing protein [Apiospora arundinis]
MASLISKRQQARNEKALQELMHSVPGNKMCADCGSRNPGWASWSLGIFLCMRCASIHRKLGTHISKVKSLTMDGWTNDQVDNMRKVGNVASNKVYNPQNKKPPVPIDADEADSAMERFIRSKYAQVPSAASNTGRPGRSRSVESDEGTPPPLPPKTGSKFFKSGSIFRSNKKSLENQHGPRSPPADLRNKPSKVFGASVQHDTIDDTAQKLSQLREMGFADDKRNAMVLKGVNGNLEKTIEALVRLGEGGGVSPSLTTPRQESFPSFPPQTSHSLGPPPRTPTSSSMSRLSPAASPASNNPWDMPPAQPQSSQSTGTLPNRNPFLSTNPFGMPAQQAEFTLNQSLQNLSLAPSQQPQQLFPHHTGGIPVSQPVQQPLYQQSMTPPIPQNQNFASVSFNNNQTYPQPAQPAQNNYNPFLQAPGAQPPQSLSLNTSNAQSQQGAFGNNPFARSPTRLTSPTLGQIPEQTQQNFYASPQSLYGNNPFLALGQPAQQMPYGQPLQQQQQQQPQQQQFQPQAQQQPQGFDQMFYQTQQHQQQQQPQTQTPWHDKASIMALYNYPSLAPAPTQQPQEQAPQSATEAPAGGPQSAAQQQQQQQQQPQRSVSTPLPGHNNPFLNGSMGTAPAAPSYGAAPKTPRQVVAAAAGAESR